MVNQEKNVKVLGLIFLTIVSSWITVVFLVLLSSMPFSAIGISRNMRHNVVLFVPQGWGFFTRNPREEREIIYRRQENKWILSNLSNSATYAGASRAGRLRSGEISALIKLIKPGDWRGTSGDVNKWKADSIITILNPYEHPTVCGRHLLQLQAAIPWAWYHIQQKKNAKAKFVEVNIICNH